MTPRMPRLLLAALLYYSVSGCSLGGSPYALSRASKDGLLEWQGDTTLKYTKRKGFRASGILLSIECPDGGSIRRTVDTPGTTGELELAGLLLEYVEGRFSHRPAQLPASGTLRVSLIRAPKKGGSYDTEAAKAVSNVVLIPYSSRDWKPGQPTGLKDPDYVHEAGRRLPPDLGQLANVRVGPLGDRAGSEDYARGLRLKKQGRLDEALTALLDARARTLNHVKVWSAIAWVLLVEEDTEAAAAWFTWVARLAPETPEGQEAAKALQRLGKTLPDPRPKPVSG